MGDIVRNGIHEWLQKTISKKGFSKYEIKLSHSEKCNGYLGDITFINVTCADNSQQREYNYIAKSGKDSKELRKQALVHEAYMNEIFFYKEVIPVFNRFQLKKNAKQTFNSVAEFIDEFMYQDIEFLILENLSTSGFVLHDKMRPLNLDHLKLTFQEYGKYHALSFGLREDEPELFETLRTGITDVFALHPNKQKLFDNIKKNLQEAYVLLETEPKVKDAFKNIEQNVENILTGINDPDYRHFVLSHGDCWNNNFMYKYNDKNRDKPQEVRFLDFQMPKLASPVHDLSYHLYACASKKELAHFEELLHIYHKSLSEFLCQCGYDPDKIFSFETLLDHWRKYSAYGLVFSIFTLRIVLCNEDEEPDLATVSEKGSFEDVFLMQPKDKSIYEQRIRDNIFHYFASINCSF